MARAKKWKPVKKAKWVELVTEQAKTVGTYQDAFAPVIGALGDILERRDLALQDFLDSGGEGVIEHISDRGAVVLKKNPRLTVWQDLNAQALAYWRELGLTPAGLKKLNEEALKPAKPGSPLEEALKNIGG